MIASKWIGLDHEVTKILKIIDLYSSTYCATINEDKEKEEIGERLIPGYAFATEGISLMITRCIYE